MKSFEFGEVVEAMKHAAEGGQALHLFDPRPFCKPSTPNCFKRAKEAGHLFDQNLERLRKTAMILGVRVVKVDRLSQKGQHVDLVGKPLERAKNHCKADALPDLFGGE
jgi:hypothetical protein